MKKKSSNQQQAIVILMIVILSLFGTLLFDRVSGMCGLSIAALVAMYIGAIQGEKEARIKAWEENPNKDYGGKDA